MFFFSLCRVVFRGWFDTSGLGQRAGIWLVTCCVLVLMNTGGAAASAVPGKRDAYHEAMLAVAQGRLVDARELLNALSASEPLHAGARLDLAMLYCAMGDAALAFELFDDIEQRFSPPPAILAVISQKRLQGCTGWQPRSLTTLRLGRGFDSNVNQGALDPVFSLGTGLEQIDWVLLPEYLPQKDAYSSLGLEWLRELSPNGLAFVLHALTRQYDGLQAYDSAVVSGGVEWPWQWGRWSARGGVSAGVTTLNEHLYSRQMQAQLELLAPLTLPSDWQVGLGASWSQIEYPGLDQMDARWLESRMLLRYTKGNKLFQAQAGWLKDAQAGRRPGGDRHGWQVGVLGRVGLGPRFSGELGAQVQHWRGEQVYSPGLIDVVRHQHTRQLRAALVYQPNAQQSWTLELKDVVNDENVSVFAYREQLVQVLWQWQLPTR